MIFGAEARLPPKLRFEVRRHPRIPPHPTPAGAGCAIECGASTGARHTAIEGGGSAASIEGVNAPRVQGAPAIEGAQPLTGTGRAGH